ncbi:MAG: 6-phosphogluconolactonase [Alphaproteobacteria bacterium]|nr:6-phosphogluconolactonase [Alphaproteobacteria bacterium]
MSFVVSDQPAIAAADAVVRAVRRVVADKGHCVLATAGGTTPVAVFLAIDDQLDDVLDRLAVTVVDERHLGVGGDWESLPDESNTRLLHAAWLARRPAQPTVTGWAIAGTLETARRALDSAVPTPDVLLLGMGPDGHIASLFPGHAALTAPGRVLALSDSPKPPPERLTMSLSLLREASEAVVLITGASKRDATRRVLAGDPHLPLTLLAASGGPRILGFLDADAEPRSTDE